MQRKSFPSPPALEPLFFLRFPSGVILGQTLIVGGNSSVENAEQAGNFGFSIWTLDLETNIVKCVDLFEDELYFYLVWIPHLPLLSMS